MNLSVNTVGKHLKAGSFCTQPRYTAYALNRTYFPAYFWSKYKWKYEVFLQFQQEDA